MQHCVLRADGRSTAVEWSFELLHGTAASCIFIAALNATKFNAKIKWKEERNRNEAKDGVTRRIISTKRRVTNQHGKLVA